MPAAHYGQLFKICFIPVGLSEGVMRDSDLEILGETSPKCDDACLCLLRTHKFALRKDCGRGVFDIVNSLTKKLIRFQFLT